MMRSATSANLIAYLMLLSCDFKKEVNEEKQQPSASILEAERNAPKLPCRKSRSFQFVDIKTHRYLLIADYTRPAAEGYVPFCFFDTNDLEIELVEIDLEFIETQLNTDIILCLKFHLKDGTIVVKKTTRRSVTGLNPDVFDSAEAVEQSATMNRWNVATFGKFDQTSDLHVIFANDIGTIRSNLEVSPTYPFWEWRPSFLERPHKK